MSFVCTGNEQLFLQEPDARCFDDGSGIHFRNDSHEIVMPVFGDFFSVNKMQGGIGRHHGVFPRVDESDCNGRSMKWAILIHEKHREVPCLQVEAMHNI